MDARINQKSFVILTIDGGGVRGIVPALVLYDLEQKLERVRKLRQLHANGRILAGCFDLIAGTSTGGIIALALGQLGLPTGELLALYREVPALVFPDMWKSNKWLRLIHNGAIYDAKKLKEKLETYVKGRKMAVGTGLPMVFVLSRDESTNPPEGHLFRNYDPPIFCSKKGSTGVQVVDAALATTAAPVIFEPHEIELPTGGCRRFSDGGLTATNPTKLAWEELKDFQRDYQRAARTMDFEVIILSIGTGDCPKEMKTIDQNMLGIMEEFVMSLTDAEVTHEEVTKETKRTGVKYFRFNPSIQKTSVFTNDQEVQNYLVSITEKYLTKDEVNHRMMELVDKLIEHEQVNAASAKIFHRVVQNITTGARLSQNIYYSILLIGGKESESSAEWFCPWDPSRNRLLSTPHPSPRRNHFSLILNSSGSVLIAGGWDGHLLSSAVLLDPITESWTTVKSMGDARMDPGAAVVDGAVYVCGGWNGFQSLDSCERFRSGVWESITPMSQARHGLRVVAFDGKLYAIGGTDNSGSLSVVEAYDIQTDSWTDRRSMPMALEFFGVAVLGKSIIVCGGFPGSGQACLKYDMEADRWSTIAQMNQGRRYFRVVALGAQLVALGGLAESAKFTAEVYDPGEDEWTMLNAKFKHGRWDHSANVFLPGFSSM